MLHSVQVPVQTEGELVELMQQGIAKRTVARTGMNAASSRSHCLVMLAVEKHWLDGSVGHGKLCLVDLAGALLEQFLLQHETCICDFHRHIPANPEQETTFCSTCHSVVPHQRHLNYLHSLLQYKAHDVCLADHPSRLFP